MPKNQGWANTSSASRLYWLCLYDCAVACKLQKYAQRKQASCTSTDTLWPHAKLAMQIWLKKCIGMQHQTDHALIKQSLPWALSYADNLSTVSDSEPLNSSTLLGLEYMYASSPCLMRTHQVCGCRWVHTWGLWVRSGTRQAQSWAYTHPLASSVWESMLKFKWDLCSNRLFPACYFIGACRSLELDRSSHHCQVSCSYGWIAE